MRARMPFKLSNSQIKAVLEKNTDKRHSHFFEEIVGWQQLW